MKHLLRVGPVSPVKQVAGVINLDESTRTPLLASIELIRCAADVIDIDDADRHARWAIRVLADQAIVTERLRPTFVVPIYVLGMLASLVPIVSPEMLREIIDHLTSHPAQEDGAIASRYGTVVASIPETAWREHDLNKLAAREGDGFELEERITGVLALAKPGTRESLLPEIADGDLMALAALGDVADLPTPIVAALVQNLTAQIGQQVAGLRGGQSADRRGEPASVLAVINVQHPEEANWTPIVELLNTWSPFTNHLEPLLRSVRQTGRRIGAAGDQLVPALRNLLVTPAAALFPGHRNIRGAAGAALAAIQPDAVAAEDVWDLMSGEPHLRSAAALIVTSKAQPAGVDVLASLAFDPAPEVRATVASCLAYWITHDVAVEPSFALLKRLLNAAGTEVARVVAQGLTGADSTDAVRALGDLLRNHPSRYVRTVAAEHT